jgi:hypothetical protein
MACSNARILGSVSPLEVTKLENRLWHYFVLGPIHRSICLVHTPGIALSTGSNIVDVSSLFSTWRRRKSHPSKYGDFCFLKLLKQRMDNVKNESSNTIPSRKAFGEEQTMRVADRCNSLVKLSEFLENTLVSPFCKPNDWTGACQLLLLAPTCCFPCYWVRTLTTISPRTHVN